MPPINDERHQAADVVSSNNQMESNEELESNTLMDQRLDDVGVNFNIGFAI